MPYKDQLKRRKAKRECQRQNREHSNAYERERRAKNPKAFRQTRLKTRYGLTHDDYQKLYEKQAGVCALCLDRPASDVDHDHATGVVRGLLCRACNLGIGMFGENIDRIKRVIVYLSTPRPQANPENPEDRRG